MQLQIIVWSFLKRRFTLELMTQISFITRKTFVIGNKIHTHTWNKILFDDSKKQKNESLQNHVFYDNHNDKDKLCSLQTMFLRIMIVPIFWEVYKINKFPISFGFCIISFYFFRYLIKSIMILVFRIHFMNELRLSIR